MWPHKAQYRPGEEVVLYAPGAVAVDITELGHHRARLMVVDGEAHWPAPAVVGRHARGFWAEAIGPSGAPVDRTGFDVAAHWSVAPRYGFLSNFTPADTAAAVTGLNRLHLNVVQFYDWMYTHYQFFAEQEEFIDPLGRPTSHRVVRARIDACHRHGIACLAYGAMYGGERAIAERYPEWLLYDGDGRPYSLGEFFYIQNIERDSPWRAQILGEYEAALSRMGFDGIHIDQYGFPKRALYRPASGEERMVDLTTAMPDFVMEAGELLRRVRPGGGNLFNCVNNWPVECVAPLQADAATYIEVWPPHETYRDLHALIRHARAVGPHKQVILAAYLRPFHRDSSPSTGAMTTLRLATAAIYASGGFHLALGEGDGVLAEGYYPTFGRLTPEQLEVAVRYYDFITAYGELLHDLDLRDVSDTWNGGINLETTLSGAVTCGPQGASGSIWTLLREKPGRRVLHLINLAGLAHDRWNDLQPEPLPQTDIVVRLQRFAPIRAVWYASPDEGGAPRRLAVEPCTDGLPYISMRIERLYVWGMIWTEE